jgi:hypothetical protein
MIIHPMLEAIFGDVDQASVRWCVLWDETRHRRRLGLRPHVGVAPGSDVLRLTL